MRAQQCDVQEATISVGHAAELSTFDVYLQIHIDLRWLPGGFILCIADYIALAQAEGRHFMCRATRGRCSLRVSQRKSFFAWACAMEPAICSYFIEAMMS